MCTVAAASGAAVAAASGAASVRVWHITSRGWDPWTEREVVRVAYPPYPPSTRSSPSGSVTCCTISVSVTPSERRSSS
jgi:hypothetical protein